MPSIQVDSVQGRAIHCHINEKTLCRISAYQHESAYLSPEVAKQYAPYLFTIDNGNPFVLFYEVATAAKSPYMMILAECQGYSEPISLNFQVEEQSFGRSPFPESWLDCNSKMIRFHEVSQLKDSCIYVTIQYEGSGDYYAIIRAGNNNPVDATNIIQEGIYLGQ